MCQSIPPTTTVTEPMFLLMFLYHVALLIQCYVSIIIITSNLMMTYTGLRRHLRTWKKILISLINAIYGTNLCWNFKNVIWFLLQPIAKA